MAKATSCGLLSYRETKEKLEVLLVHPGGPYWRGKDDGAWSIPKGLAEPGEDLLAAAQREFREETGFTAGPPFLALTPLRQKSRKVIHCWAFAANHDLSQFKSEPFELEWPPHSGKIATFPEADAARYFGICEAETKITPGQSAFLAELVNRLGAAIPG